MTPPQAYLPSLRYILTQPLRQHGQDAIPGVIEAMHEYCINRCAPHAQAAADEPRAQGACSGCGLLLTRRGLPAVQGRV